MKFYTFLLLALTIVASSPIGAEESMTLDRAKAGSIESGRPILLEFIHED